MSFAIALFTSSIDAVADAGQVVGNETTNVPGIGPWIPIPSKTCPVCGSIGLFGTGVFFHILGSWISGVNGRSVFLRIPSLGLFGAGAVRQKRNHYPLK